MLTILAVAFLALSLIWLPADVSAFLPSLTLAVIFAFAPSIVPLGSLMAFAPSLFKSLSSRSESLALSISSSISRGRSTLVRLKDESGGGRPIRCWTCGPILEVLSVKSCMFCSVAGFWPASRQHIASANAMREESSTVAGSAAL